MNSHIHKISEITEQQLHELANIEVGKAAVLFMSPLCGTCKLAMKMLEVVAEMNISYRLYTVNLNFTPYYREHWRISSIPALVLIQNGAVVKTIYAMGSVAELYEQLL